MRNRPMCPMMMGQMPMMPMMEEPMQMPMQMQTPMCMQMPMMEEMEQPMTMPAMKENEDDRDEEQFTAMYGDTCHKMMPYVKSAVDRMEETHDIYEERPDRNMVDNMTEEAYNDLVRDMPDMADNMSADRIIVRPRRFARDLLGVLLINELLGRRRRRRRFHDGYQGYGMYGPDYGYGPDFYSDDYDYYY